MTNTTQGDRQQSARNATGTQLDYNGDWSALFQAAGIAPGSFNGRLLAWINIQLGTSYSNLPGAMQAFAVSQSATNWASLGTFTIISPLLLLQDGTSKFLLQNGSDRLILIGSPL